MSVAALVTPLPLAAGSLGRGLALVAVGALVLAAVGLQFLRARALYGGDGTDPDETANCPACGALVAADAETCEHCGEPLDG